MIIRFTGLRGFLFNNKEVIKNIKERANFFITKNKIGVFYDLKSSNFSINNWHLTCKRLSQSESPLLSDVMGSFI